MQRSNVETWRLMEFEPRLKQPCDHTGTVPTFNSPRNTRRWRALATSKGLFMDLDVDRSGARYVGYRVRSRETTVTFKGDQIRRFRYDAPMKRVIEYRGEQIVIETLIKEIVR